MIRFCNAFAVLMAALCTARTAYALPLVWRADWPDAKPVETLVHRGTDVELQPQWRINKMPADTNGWTFTTYCQTNAVGPWFGPLPGAFFSHTNDVGAASYNVIVRAQTPGGDVNYTAFARLRMLDSPGFTPGALPLPTQTLDFADVTVFNAPYYTKAETDERIVALAPAPGNYAAVSNAAMSAVQPSALSKFAETGSVFNAVASSVLTGRKDWTAEGIDELEQNVAAAATAATNYTDAATNVLLSSACSYTDSAIAAADTTYRRTVGITNLNQSVQFVTLGAGDTTLSIELPANGETKDWIVYVLATAETALTLPPATWYMADKASTNAIPAGMTALYFSQMATGIYLLGRQELEPVTIQGN